MELLLDDDSLHVIRHGAPDLRFDGVVSVGQGTS
jgi:hypothetical protein